MSRVTDVRYVGYAVPDLAAERAFYADTWKLKEVADEDGLVYFAAHGHDELYVVRLRQADERRVDVVALAADSRADVDALHDKVVASGAKVIWPPRELETYGGGYGFRFFNPDGIEMEISAEVGRGDARALEAREAIPEKISHVVFHSPQHKEITQWFIDVLGFRLSDWIGDFMSLIRCNSAHHRIAFLPGPACLNHVAYDMPDLNEMMRGLKRLRRDGHDTVWGPGRHTAGDNTFAYFVTPAGFAVEYTSELEEIADDDGWEPRSFTPAPDIMDQWGIGTGGPQTMPKPAPDAGLFTPSGV
ncbi:oxidoreductase [Erythrobacter arachoides]|uniref:Oxidoreductase n=1 Tax=Aurantiacibacter arachoides TaxID=1850444 RepID=A0A844ZZF6_9SPHN|nr:VOC family protein [Aurantiacibacter arachoides]MXO92612.1 oxidoreductase [Aurantiacibacter arachoides]GGD55787.1 oxidoreductase [Aurantiacibacter arachoides]